MQVRALRGVCVGVGQNMRGPVKDEGGKIVTPGETRDLDEETARYLKAIRAVEDAHGERSGQESAGKSK
jgi:hypothetical protein